MLQWPIMTYNCSSTYLLSNVLLYLQVQTMLMANTMRRRYFIK